MGGQGTTDIKWYERLRPHIREALFLHWGQRGSRTGPREAVLSPDLEAFKTRQDPAQYNLVPSQSWSSCEQEVGLQPCQSFSQLERSWEVLFPTVCIEQALILTSHSNLMYKVSCLAALLSQTSQLHGFFSLCSLPPILTLYNREGNPLPVDIIFSPGIYLRARKPVTTSGVHEKQQEKIRKQTTIEHAGQRTGPPQAYRPPE